MGTISGHDFTETWESLDSIENLSELLSESLYTLAISVESIRFSAPICFSVPIQFCTAVVRFALVPRLRSGAVRGPTVSSQRQTIYAAKATTASYGCQRLWRKISSTAPPEHSLLSLFSGRMSLAVTGGYWALEGIRQGPASLSGGHGIGYSTLPATLFRQTGMKSNPATVLCDGGLSTSAECYRLPAGRFVTGPSSLQVAYLNGRILDSAGVHQARSSGKIFGAGLRAGVRKRESNGFPQALLSALRSAESA